MSDGDDKCIVTTDKNSLVLPKDFPQINSYLRSFSMSQSSKMNSNVILLRIHTVGKEAEQLISFQSGLSAINRKYPLVFKKLVIQYLNNDIVRSNDMGPSEIISWLLDGHIHSILGHIHQGIAIKSNLRWNVRRAESEILKLKYHLGHPNGVHVHDPVFLQDKFSYLAAIKDFTLPTLKIPLKLGDLKQVTAVVRNFCKENINCPEDALLNGYVLKVPYTTNNKYRRLRNVAEIMSAVQGFLDDYLGVIPYVMLQAYLHNTVEYKVVCFNGNALYEANIDNCCRSRGLKKAFLTKDARFEFAELVLRSLQLICPCVEQRSLIRVDLFWCDYLNKIVVNELESLEARFPANDREAIKEQFLRQYISVYHANSLLDALSQHTNQILELAEYPTWPFA